MKKIHKFIKIVCFIFIFVPILCLFTACDMSNLTTNTNNTTQNNDAITDNDTPPNDESNILANIIFANQTIDYDGEEHQIVITEELPDGVNVEYENNSATNAGTYNATATLSMDGYEPLILHATLTINKINYDMSGVQWNYNNQTNLIYNGNEQSVSVIGLPNGVTICNYQNNAKTNAGHYIAQVTFNYDTINHNAPTLPDLEWDIQKATYDMSNVHWTYENAYVYDGEEKVVLITGLPTGVTIVSYSNNRQTEIGTYTATVTLNYDTTNYNTISIDNCIWVIRPDLSELASFILNKIIQVPDPWEFLPESFSLGNKAYTGDTEIDYTNFVNVSSLPRIAMGKQMNVVYSTLINAEEALNYVRYIHGSINTIISMYQTFINSNPDNYATYESNTSNFSFKIELTDDNYLMFVSLSTINMQLTYDKANNHCMCRAQLSNSNAIKYEMAENEITIAIELLGLSLTKLHFERENDAISGYIYEYIGTSEHNIKTSALIKIDETYTSIISNKRETDDYNIEGNLEVYNNSTGNLIGTALKETLSAVKYETVLFNIWDVSNITSIKVINEQNGRNLDTIYINGSDNPVAPKNVGGFSLKTASRRFDIEMKNFYLYTYNENEEKYQTTEILLPMLFIQTDFVNSFATDFYNNNSSNGAISPTDITLSTADKTYLLSEYATLIDEYLDIKENVTYQSIIDYIGEQDECFNQN